MITLDKLHQEVFTQIKILIDNNINLRKKLDLMSKDELIVHFSSKSILKLSKLQAEYNKIMNCYNKATEALEEDLLTKYEYNFLRNEYPKTLNELKIKISKTKAEIDENIDNFQDKLVWIDEICNLQGKTEFTRKDILLIVEKIVVSKDGVFVFGVEF